MIEDSYSVPQNIVRSSRGLNKSPRYTQTSYNVKQTLSREEKIQRIKLACGVTDHRKPKRKRRK